MALSLNESDSLHNASGIKSGPPPWEKNHVLQGAVFGLSIIIFKVNLLGLALLLRKGSKHVPQRVFLVSYSASNITVTFLHFLHVAVLISPAYDSPGRIETAFDIFLFAEAAYLLIYHNITFILVDRFLEVYLHLRYNGSLFRRWRRRFVASIWIFSLLGAFLALTIAKILDRWTLVYMVASGHVRPVYAFMLLLASIVVYLYLYSKLIRSQRGLPPRQEGHRPRFMLPLLLVCNFIVFTFVPDVTIGILRAQHRYWHPVTLMYLGKPIFDPVVYVFLHPSLREQMMCSKEELNVMASRASSATSTSAAEATTDA